MQRPKTATLALKAHVNGDAEAAARLVPLVYSELRSLARAYIQAEGRDHTLPPTALVHEAYMRLVGMKDMNWVGKTHFAAIAAREMRRVLVEHARARDALKRGGDFTRVALYEGAAVTEDDQVGALALDQALSRLQDNSERQGRIAELRLYSGMCVPEVAVIVGVSERTVKADWRLARAWLARELSAGSPG